MMRFFFRRLSGSFRGKGTEEKRVSNRFEETPAINDRSEPELRAQNTEERGKDWFFVGKDEEGTPVYLDRNTIIRQIGSTTALIRLKYVPGEKSRSLDQARRYLREAGTEWKRLNYIEHLLELDLNRNLMADLLLFFFDPDDRLIEQVRFSEQTFRPLETEEIYSTIRGIVDGQENRMELKTGQEQPGIDERIQSKLQEINEALEAFDKI